MPGHSRAVALRGPLRGHLRVTVTELRLRNVIPFYFVMLSSAGAPTSVRLGEQVMIMISSVRT